MTTVSASFEDHCRALHAACTCGVGGHLHHLRHRPACAIAIVHFAWTADCAAIWQQIKHIPVPSEYPNEEAYRNALDVYRGWKE